MTNITDNTISGLRDKIGAMSPIDIKWINSLIYAEPGGGKTHLIGTAADALDTSPVLVLDIDGGGTTLKKFSGEIDVVQVRSLDQLNSIYIDLRNSIDPVTGEMYYKTLGIDSTSELQKLDMRTIMTKTVEQHPDREIEVPSQREWGICLEHMRNIVRLFRDLPCHTIFTAHCDIQVDQKTNRRTYAPALSGKSKHEISGFLDIVGYMQAVASGGEIKRQIQFVKTESVIAKDRTGLLGSLLVDPTIPYMWDLIHTPKGEVKAA